MEHTNVTIVMESGDEMTVELYPEHAPITVANFLKLVKQNFYDGLIFHRVIENFMIQGGDPTGTGSGGSDEEIKGEFTSNGVKNTLKHTEGVISMARSNDPNSASSQFFIMHKTCPHLDGNYAAFGKVINGQEVVDKIAKTKTDAYDRPKQEQKIKTIKIL
ncbi:MAG TPA: peptidylprolyl isomerase [Clostridia bacterium]|nr:peptidylprolyl isomerase [Clostridia bacterium]